MGAMPLWPNIFQLASEPFAYDKYVGPVTPRFAGGDVDRRLLRIARKHQYFGLPEDEQLIVEARARVNAKRRARRRLTRHPH